MLEQGTLIEEIKIKSNWNVGPIEKDKYYSWEELFELYEILYGEYEALLEELEDFKRDVEDNYRPIPVAEQYGISERDFI